MNFPKTLPMSLLACPPNSVFIKQYSETVEVAKVSNQTSRGTSEKKEWR